MDQGFVHLHCHDEYSVLDGLGTVDSVVETASSLGFTALAQTNHGVIDGFLKFSTACRKWAIKPLFGVELYYVDDRTKKPKKEKRRHLTILVKDERGFSSLNRILNGAHLEGYHRRPRADKALILGNTEGLIVLSGCASGPLSQDEDLDFVLQLVEAVGQDFYLEIMPHDFGPQNLVNQRVYELWKELHIPIVATNDVHYPTKRDEKLHEVLLAIQRKSKWTDAKRWKFDVGGLYQRTHKEMVDAFKAMKECPFGEKDILDALHNTLGVTEKCVFGLEQQPIDLPVPPSFVDRNDATEALLELCYEGYRDKIKVDPGDVYWNRMAYELDILSNLKFERYFLIVYDLVMAAKQKGIMVGPGRGSVGGSLVAYLLGITTVDPIKYNLMFERFISPERNDLPDIDMDFEKSRREEVLGYLRDTYGHDCVAQVSTSNKMLGRTALRDVARVFDIPYLDVDMAAKSIPDDIQEQVREGHTIEDAFNTFEEGKRFKTRYPEVTDFAQRLEGQVRHHGLNAAGVVISRHSFRDGNMGHLTRRSGNEGDAVMVCWDKDDLEHFGLVKLDVLGLTNLSVLDICKQSVKENHGVDIDFESMEPNDPRVLEEFNLGNTAATFQFGSRGMQKFCPQIGVESFKDLCDINTLYRPAALRGGIADTYEKRKKGFEPVSYLHPLIEAFTDETFGMVIYQEQVMQLLHELGGLSWQACDKVRKVIGKSLGVEAFKKFEEMFVQGCVEKGTMQEAEACRVFDMLKHHGSYSFNKAHAVEYSLLGYYDMWCKYYYPAEYMAALLSMDQKPEKVSDYMREVRRLGIGVKLPDINQSDARYWRVIYLDGKPTILCPFSMVRGIGEKSIDELMRAKADGTVFREYGEFVKSIDKRICNKRVLEALMAVGAFDCLDGVDIQDREVTAKDYLQWDVVSPYLAYDSLIGRFSEHLGILAPGEVEGADGYLYTWGRVTGFKLRYSKDVKGGAKARSADARASATLEGKNNFTSLMFDEEVFSQQKATIEKLEDTFVLVKGHRAGKSGIAVSRFWLLDDLMAGYFNPELPFKPLQDSERVDHQLVGRLKDCRECHLRETCQKPVPFSDGELSVMVIGEAPGADEERDGKGFVGRAGELLWKTLGLERELFHISNIVKCRPPDNRTPTKIEAKFCSGKWLDEEIRSAKPWVIFAVGNVARYFFTGEEHGIMEASGKVEWNFDYGCWVVYGLHPAAVLRQQENSHYLEKACEAFRKMLLGCI